MHWIFKILVSTPHNLRCIMWGRHENVKDSMYRSWDICQTKKDSLYFGTRNFFFNSILSLSKKILELRNVWAQHFLHTFSYKKNFRPNCFTPTLFWSRIWLCFPPSQLRTTKNKKYPHQNIPEDSVQQTWNFELRLNSQNSDQVTTAMDGHPPSPWWSPTISRMVTQHLKYGNQNSKGWSPSFQRTVTHHPQDGHSTSKGWSPTIPRMVIQYLNG